MTTSFLSPHSSVILLFDFYLKLCNFRGEGVREQKLNVWIFVLISFFYSHKCNGKFIAYKNFISNNRLQLNYLNKRVAVAEKMYVNWVCITHEKIKVITLFMKNRRTMSRTELHFFTGRSLNTSSPAWRTVQPQCRLNGTEQCIRGIRQI